MSTRSIDKKPVILVSAMMAVGLLLRWFDLGKQSLWLDEFFSWWCSMRTFWGSVYCDVNKPPLYYPMMHQWMALFGNSETAMRALSIPPAIGSIWLMYLLGTRLFSRPVGYIGAAYLTVSSFHIYYAQEARNYTLLVFFLLLAGLFLWDAMEATTTKRRFLYYALYTVSITLALYTHYFAAFFIAAHGLYILFRRTRQLLWGSVSVGLAIAAIVPFLLIMLRTPGGTEAQSRHYLLLKVPQAYFSFLFGDTLIPLDAEAVAHVKHTLATNGFVLLLAIGSVGIFLPFLWTAWKRWGEPFTFCVLNATIPVLIAFLISFKLMLFDERYMIPSSPYVYFMVGAAIWEIVLWRRKGETARWRTSAGFAAVAAYGLLLVISAYHYYFEPRYGKEQWRDAIAYLEASSSRDTKELLVFDPDYLFVPYGYYERHALPYLRLTPDVWRDLLTPAGLEAHVHGYRRIFLLRSHSMSDEIRDLFQRKFRQTGYRDFPVANGIEVYSFEVPQGS